MLFVVNTPNKVYYESVFNKIQILNEKQIKGSRTTTASSLGNSVRLTALESSRDKARKLTTSTKRQEFL